MNDIFHNLKTTQISAPAVRTSTQTSSEVDMQGFGSLNVLFNLGESGDTLSGSVKWTIKLQHSDASGSGFADVDVADLLSDAATVVVDSGSEDDAVYIFGYKGNKRYVRAVIAATGTHTNGTPMAISAIQGDASLHPVA